MKRYWMLLLFVAGLLSGMSGSARADSCTATASDISFGSVSPIANTAVTATGTITVTCTWSALTLNRYALVCLNLGTGTASTSFAPRYLAYGSNLLAFNLYSDAAYSMIWGSTSSSTTPTPISLTLSSPYSLLTQNVSQTVTVYGKIPSGQTTVPTASNATTTYSNSFSGSHTRLDYAFALTSGALPGCSAINSGVRFPFTVTANVVNNCYISATPMSFGSTSVLTSALAATSTISVQCTSGDAWQLALNGGSTSGNVTARQMTGASYGSKVNYQLYTDSARSTIWGDGTGGTSMATGTGTGVAATLTVYGKVPAQTTPRPDTYSDTVTATISF